VSRAHASGNLDGILAVDEEVVLGQRPPQREAKARGKARAEEDDEADQSSVQDYSRR